MPPNDAHAMIRCRTAAAAGIRTQDQQSQLPGYRITAYLKSGCTPGKAAANTGRHVWTGQLAASARGQRADHPGRRLHGPAQLSDVGSFPGEGPKSLVWIQCMAADEGCGGTSATLAGILLAHCRLRRCAQGLVRLDFERGRGDGERQHHRRPAKAAAACFSLL